MNIIQIESARIGFRNFEGREGKYNKAGDRSFAVFLPFELADELASQGWNVKFPPANGPIDPDAPQREPYLSVSVTIDKFPANVVLIANDRPEKLVGEEIGMLDWAEITNVDLIIRPYEWTVNGNSGVKAYLKAGYFTINTDPFASKYGI